MITRVESKLGFLPSRKLVLERYDVDLGHEHVPVIALELDGQLLFEFRKQTWQEFYRMVQIMGEKLDSE